MKTISHGAGEIMINNINNDGSLLGYDIKLIKMISEKIKSPILALGGAGNWQHILDLFQMTDVSALALKIFFILLKKV